jgi:competence protein ComEA
MKSPALSRLLQAAAIAAFTFSVFSPAVHAADEKKPAPIVEKSTPAASPATAPAAAPAAKPAQMRPAERMDVNSASEDQLATLDGIGKARAAAIVKGRPYTGKDDLVKKKILPQGVYDKIQDQIIARQK